MIKITGLQQINKRAHDELGKWWGYGGTYAAMLCLEQWKNNPLDLKIGDLHTFEILDCKIICEVTARTTEDIEFTLRHFQNPTVSWDF